MNGERVMEGEVVGCGGGYLDSCCDDSGDEALPCWETSVNSM